jgi:HD superfamily phosphohydrolase
MNKENNELILHIYQDAEMSCYTIEKLLTDLKEKDNKITKYVEDILHEYQGWKAKSKKLLQKENAEISENSFMAKFMAGQGIKSEVNEDNSDSAIADMLIKGISMGSIDMEKKISAYKDDVNKEDLTLAKDFMKFQERAIENLKQYL